MDAGPGSVPGVTGIHEGTAGSHTPSGLGMSGGKRTRGSVWDPSGKAALWDLSKVLSPSSPIYKMG